MGAGGGKGQWGDKRQEHVLFTWYLWFIVHISQYFSVASKPLSWPLQIEHKVLYNLTSAGRDSSGLCKAWPSAHSGLNIKAMCQCLQWEKTQGTATWASEYCLELSFILHFHFFFLPECCQCNSSVYCSEYCLPQQGCHTVNTQCQRWKYGETAKIFTGPFSV